MKRSDLRNKHIEQDEAERREAIRALAEHSQGRAFLWWLLQVGKFGTQPFAQNALVMSFQCGELNVGQQIMNEIATAAPGAYPLMMKEQLELDRARMDELSDANEDDFQGGVG